MALISPVEMPDEEKLETLRRLDQFRWWRCVDERRYCLVCCKIITGRQIQVIGGTRGNGPLRVICSTKGCHSIPMDWVHPTDEVLARLAALAFERSNASVPDLHYATARNSTTFSWRKFALHFKRSV
jgi:hypothetical protein